MSEIIVRNQKILDFYKRNPSLNFEQINLIIIDLLDQLQNGEVKRSSNIRRTSIKEKLGKFGSKMEKF